jgi:hypothetical protein
MKRTTTAGSFEEIRALIVEGLRLHRPEIEQAIYLRVCDAVPDPFSDRNPEYEKGAFAAVKAVVGYSLDAIEQGSEWPESIPPDAAIQARRAARAGVSLGIIQRRYIAGHAKLGEFIGRETERKGLANDGQVHHHLRRTQESLLEHLTAAIECEYLRERTASTREQHRLGLVQRLLAKEPVDPADLAELDYQIHARWHLGVIATGAGVDKILRRLSMGSGELLSVSFDTKMWTWYGGRQRASVEAIENLWTNGHVSSLVAIGEPGLGIDGWRLTHCQAQAALGVALRKPQRFARYTDHRLLAAALQNDTLAESLKQKYLSSLGSQRDGGVKLRQTLRAHIDAGCIASSAAAALRVDRHTVEDRVRTAERLLGCPLRVCLAELDVALRVEELDRAFSPEDPPLM